jgi:PIN domain nuclease of toxin-antitoxin system
LRLLLDTHVWLWATVGPVAKLSKPVARRLQSATNEIWVSPVSVWELYGLAESGRVRVKGDIRTWIERLLREWPVSEAPLTSEVALESRRIDLPHQDPADRFLAATALVYDLTLVTADERLLASKRISLLAIR